MTYIPQKGEDEVEYAHPVTGDVTMKIIAAIILGLALGWTTTALASPIQQNTNQDRIAALEARLQASEYLRWTEEHAINAVSQRVRERYSSCNLNRYDCYTTDGVLIAFTVVQIENASPNYSVAVWDNLAEYANTQPVWYAQDNGDGDSWNVWAVIKSGKEEYHITWTVWQSNGFIRGVY
jgi:hypothetical protein